MFATQPFSNQQDLEDKENDSLDHTPLLIVEDSEYLIRRRNQGNLAMSELLNLTDGVAKSKMKMIFTVNLESIDEIDPALLRPGRCFDILPFRKLTEKEASIVRERSNLPAREFKEGSYSLAEVLNESQHDQPRAQAIVKPRFGFV